MTLLSRLSQLFRRSHCEVVYLEPYDENKFVGSYGSLEEIARVGIQPDKIQLTSRRDLSREIFEILVEDDDPVVLDGLTMSEVIPPDLLDRVVERQPDLRDLAAMNYYASPELKMTLHLAIHTEVSLERFLDEMDASYDERVKLFETYRRQHTKLTWKLPWLLSRLGLIRNDRFRKSPPLGKVWGQIRGS